MDSKNLLLIGAAAASALALVVALISFVLIVDLRGDMTTLLDHSRRTAKTMKEVKEHMTDHVATIKVDAAPELAKAPEPVPTHIDSADRSHDCVLRPGDAKGLVDCIKSR